MRILFILAVLCYAIYSCTIHLDDENTKTRSYDKPSSISQNESSSTSGSLPNETVKQENEKALEEQEFREQPKEDRITDVQSEIQENPNALLNTKIIATMTLDKLEKMIANGADINATNSKGTTVLMLYSASSSPKIIEALLQKGADINAANSRGGTALIAACQRNTREVITLLLQKGANPLTQASNGKTASDFLVTNKNLSNEDMTYIYDMMIKLSRQQTNY